MNRDMFNYSIILTGAMLMLGTSFLVINGFGVLLYFPYETTETTTNQNSNGELKEPARDENNTGSEDSTNERQNELKSLTKHIAITDNSSDENFLVPRSSNTIEVFKTKEYHCLCWIFVIVSGIVAMYINNLTIILASFKLEEYAEWLPYIKPMVGMILKVILGLVSDKLAIAKPWYIIIACGVTISLTFLSIFLVGSLFFIMFTLFFIAFVNDIFLVISPYILISYFGMKHYPTAYGFMYGMVAISTLVFQFLFGIIYDAEIIDPNSMDCFGIHCYRDIFIMTTFMGIIVFVFSILLLKRDRTLRRFSRID